MSRPPSGLVRDAMDRVQIFVEAAEDDGGFFGRDVLEHIAQQVHLGRVDLHVLAAVGSDEPAGDLLEAQQLYQRVRGGDLTRIHPRDEIVLERLIGAPRLRAQIAGVGDVHLRRQVENVLGHAEGDRIEFPVEFLDVAVADDLVILEAAHHHVALAEGGVAPPENGRRDGPEFPIEVFRAVRHGRAGHAQPVARHLAEPREKPAGLTARGLRAVNFIRDHEIHALAQDPLRKRAAPGAFVIDHDEHRHAARPGELHQPLGLGALGGDARKRIVERGGHERRGAVQLDLRPPDLHHAQRAKDDVRLKAVYEREVDRHRRLARAHVGADHRAALPAGIESGDEPHRLFLVPPGSSAGARNDQRGPY